MTDESKKKETTQQQTTNAPINIRPDHNIKAPKFDVVTESYKPESKEKIKRKV